MPPRKKARAGGQAAATPTTPATNDDAMDIDTPQTGDAKSTSPENQEALKQNECWTDDQVASLFKGVIRWKPAGKRTRLEIFTGTCIDWREGMHKHFRMIAISEHLRNHGFDPDFHKHTRIPFIWQKLRTFYNLDIIDERENFEEDEPEDRYNQFSLPNKIFGEAMYQRRFADPATGDPPSSPAQFDLENGPSSPAKKRKRGDTASRTRGTSREETEDATDSQSPTQQSTTRGSRGRTRAASAAKAEKADTTEDEEDQEEEDGGEETGSGEEEVGDSEADTATQSTKSDKVAPRTRGRAATRSSRRKK